MASKSGGRTPRPTFTDQEALLFHSQGRPGKLEVVATKPMATQRDLSLAYSPGVAVPVLAIAEDESRAYDYTTKGNFVAIITNGTAILGLGNRGALAAKKWLGKRRVVDPALKQTFRDGPHGFVYAEDALLWADALGRVARPPMGKLTALVFERLAAELGVSVNEARARVRGPRPG